MEEVEKLKYLGPMKSVHGGWGRSDTNPVCTYHHSQISAEGVWEKK